MECSRVVGSPPSRDFASTYTQRPPAGRDALLQAPSSRSHLTCSEPLKRTSPTALRQRKLGGRGSRLRGSRTGGESALPDSGSQRTHAPRGHREPRPTSARCHLARELTPASLAERGGWGVGGALTPGTNTLARASRDDREPKPPKGLLHPAGGPALSAPGRTKWQILKAEPLCNIFLENVTTREGGRAAPQRGLGGTEPESGHRRMEPGSPGPGKSSPRLGDSGNCSARVVRSQVPDGSGLHPTHGP